MNRLILALALTVSSGCAHTDVPLEKFADQVSMKWGGCSTTVTRTASYAVSHCVTEQPENDQIIEIGPGHRGALPICVGRPVLDEILVTVGWPGIFRNTLVRTRHKYLGEIQGHHVMSGVVWPGQSGGAVYSAKRNCMVGSIRAVLHIKNMMFSSFFPFNVPSIVSNEPAQDYPKYLNLFTPHTRDEASDSPEHKL
jgi:hypothetical protein